MSSFADDIERLVKLHGVADDGVKPLIEKAIEMLIEKERECRRVDFPPPLHPADETRKSPVLVEHSTDMRRDHHEFVQRRNKT